jgi:hypothetical protein
MRPRSRPSIEMVATLHGYPNISIRRQHLAVRQHRSLHQAQILVRFTIVCGKEDEHSDLIKGYRKTFSRLAKAWAADGSITDDQRDEIIATVKSRSWRIWRPVLYVIPRVNIEGTGRLRSVKRPDRASYGPELQVVDLERHEFDIIELTL